jgi:hypothetical protein
MNDEREQMGNRIQVLPPAKAKPLVTPVLEPKAEPQEPRWWKYINGISVAATIITFFILAAIAAYAIGF